LPYDFLGLTNEVINRFNEVELTAANFTSARGFQVQCKNAVNDSYLWINQREWQWPFNHATATATLVAGTTRYTKASTAKVVDYDTFRISKNATLGSPGHSLIKLDYKEYMDRFVDQEDDTSTQGGLPKFVVRTPDDNFLLYPYPDKAYELKYENFAFTTLLSASTDVPLVPEQYRNLLVDGACAYGYQYRGEIDQYQLNHKRFQDGITHMQSQLINRDDYLRSHMIVRSGGSRGYVRTS